jgi:hypothetical protein
MHSTKESKSVSSQASNKSSSYRLPEPHRKCTNAKAVNTLHKEIWSESAKPRQLLTSASCSNSDMASNNDTQKNSARDDHTRHAEVHRGEDILGFFR